MSNLRGKGVALYHLTLTTATAIPHAVYGNFSAKGQSEICVSRGKVLQLLRPDSRGQIQVIASTEVFGQIRCLSIFRLPGAPTDYIVVGSDSGRIVILQFSEVKRAFVKVHQETFGRSGCRRVVPGQYVACDPTGRAVMIAAVEKQKFLYVLNRDSANQLTISSPLEAHKSRHIVFALAALDNGFENPLFAAIELDYSGADEDPTGEAASEAQKMLVYYELDLGLNHVTRKWSQPCDNGANLLIPVPGDSLKVKAEDLPGPGGVLVCFDNFVMYMHEGHDTVQTLIPRRRDLPPDRNILLLVSATHKMKNQFVVLAQSEYGDLYKISLVYDTASAGSVVSELKVKYFDTIPVCSALCILKTGFLFAASEAGDHGFYEFLSLGDDDDSVEASSSTIVQKEEGFEPLFFDPRPLRNVALVDTMMSLAPLTDMKIKNLIGAEVPQVYAACGRASRSTLRMLRPGVSVAEVAVTELPARPTAVWTVRKTLDDAYDDLIVISFGDDKATLVLRVGDTVQEVNDSGLEGKTATLGVQLLANGSLLQVHQGGLRLLGADRRINKWAPPGRRQVVACAMNTRQVVIALFGADLIYFELNPNGQLLEVDKKEGLADVNCLAIAPVPEGRERSSVVVAGCADNTVRVLSLRQADCLKVKATQATASAPSSVMLMEASISAAGDAQAAKALFLHVGLADGTLMRSDVENLSGALSDVRKRYLGNRPPMLLPMTTSGSQAMMALTSRPWLAHLWQGKFELVPVAYDALDYVAPFASAKVPEGLVAVARNAAGQGTLRVLTFERLSERFTQRTLRLAYTPRRLLVHEHFKTLIVAEADQGALPYDQRVADLQDAARQLGHASPFTPAGDMIPDLADLEEQFGAPRGPANQWGSCLRIVAPSGAALSTASVLHLGNNEAALCMCLVTFSTLGGGAAVLAVGTAKGLSFYPRQAEEGFIRIYRFAPDGRSLQLVHVTPLGPVIPSALGDFQGRLLVGCGRSLRLMECGKKKMLRKCEFQGLPSIVATIHTMGNRIFVGDAHESFHYMRYKKAENAFYIFADDSTPRYLSAALNLDYDSMAGGDKFGNVFITRMPSDISLQVEDDPTGGKFASNGGMLNSAPHKVQPVINFHVGDLLMSLQLTAMQSGGREMIVYGTISGGIGVLLPFHSAKDLDVFALIEMHMRQLAPSLVGRDHLAYRGSFFPVKDVIDGDLCEQFVTLTADKQRVVCEETDKTVGEVLKRLEEMRNTIV